MTVVLRWVSLLVIAALGVVACSKSDDGKPAATGGSGGSGGASASAGAGASSGGSTASAGRPSTSGPAISSAPPAWAPPADCHGIGNLCPNLSGCEMGSVCQLEGNVCIPAYDPNAGSLPSKSMERPYCAAYTCMTFDEASCFCTGEAGKTDPRCTSPAALAGLCQATGFGCEGEQTCCDGLSCIDRGPVSRCEQPCTTGTDCESGCCTDRWDTGVMICAEQEACTNPCKKRGEACEQGSDTTPNNCCRGSCLESENPDYAGCRPTCNTAADCPETGCCVPFSNVDHGFCADALYCSCFAVGDACGGDTPVDCCDGGVCAGTVEKGFTCRQGCTLPSDCATGCCRALSDNSASICSPAEECP